jgi:hypothetical protein
MMRCHAHMRHPDAIHLFRLPLAPELLRYRDRLLGETRSSFLNQRPAADTGHQMAIKKAREPSPLWVWLAFGLLAFGAIAYVTVVSIIEYLMAAAT